MIILSFNKRQRRAATDLPDSISNWAMIMNVSRSSLHRELKKLEANGVITYNPPNIEIHNFEALQNVLSK